MKFKETMPRTQVLVEGAIMVALAYVLSLIPIFSNVFGGSVSFFATLPLIVYSLRHSARWGVGTALVYGFLQMMLGFKNVLYMKTIPTMILCALLDYLLAYACIGLTGAIARRFKNGTVGVVVGIAGSGVLRFLCSFLSGILLWAEYAPEGTPVWLYSLTYNGGWALPDVALVLVAGLLLTRVAQLGLTERPKAA